MSSIVLPSWTCHFAERRIVNIRDTRKQCNVLTYYVPDEADNALEYVVPEPKYLRAGISRYSGNSTFKVVNSIASE